MFKKALEKKLARLEKKCEELKTRGNASEDVNELRSINAQMDELEAEIEETRSLIKSIEEDEKRAEEDKLENRNLPATGINALAKFEVEDRSAEKDPFATMEYRTAFKNYVQKGEAIPRELITRSNPDGFGPATTEDIGIIIPSTILNEFIRNVQKVYGQLYAKVRKLNVKGGVKIPIMNLSANFKWVTESTTSPNQNPGDVKDYIEFSYNIGEIRVSETLLASIVSLDIFESEITKVMVEAYVEAMDKCIVSGTGEGQPLGFLNDPRVTGNAGHTITMSANDMSDWKAWRKKLFSVIPLSKRGEGEFIFPISTVESYLLTMSDSNNNPIFKQATDLNVGENGYGRFFGREITPVEPDVLPDFDTASSGDVIGVFWNPTDYAINTQLQFGMKRYFDEEKNIWVNKALTIVDGKMVDVNGMYLLKKA